MKDFISKNRLGEILQNRPQDVAPEEILTALEDAGHEIEGYNASFDPLEAVSNIPESAKELGKAMVHLFTTNPLQTVKGIGSTALGLLEKAVPGVQSHEQAFDVLADAMVERYGSRERILNTIEQDPAGFAADLASVLTGVGGAVRGAATVGAKTALLSTAQASRLARTAATISRVGTAIDPVNVAAKLPGKTVQAIQRANDAIGLERVLRNVDVDATMKSALQLNPSQKINITRSTFTKKVGERLAQWGVSGTLEEMSEQLGEIAKRSRQALDDVLASVPDRFQPRVAEKVLDQLDALRDADIFTSQAAQNIRKRIIQLQVRFENHGLTLTELNEIKRLADEIAGERIFKTTGDLRVTNIGQNLGQLRRELRSFIETEAKKKGVGEVWDLNNQTAFAQTVKKTIDQKVLAGGPRRSLSLELAKASTLVLGHLKGMLYQVTRSPQFQSDLATAIQLLRDGDYQKLAGGVQFTRRQSKGKERVIGAFRARQKFKQANRDAVEVLNKVIRKLEPAYPTLRGVRISGEILQELTNSMPEEQTEENE